MADLNENSNTNMSDHDADASNRLDHAAEAAASSSLLLDNHPGHVFMILDRHQPEIPALISQAQVAREGFPKFKQLPAELRSKIWQDAMPKYGIYTVLMLSREEPMPQQPPAPAPIVFRAVYRLEPVPRHFQGDEMRERLDTIRSIQSACSEAAFEVDLAFPTTINCTRGKLRFNAEHDSVSLSDLQCHLGRGFFQRFARYTRGSVVFQDDWHTIPRTMLFNNDRVWRSFSVFDEWHWYNTMWPNIQAMEGFMKFLTDCSNLRTLGFAYDRACKGHMDLTWHIGAYFDFEHHSALFRLCDHGPIMRDAFYQRTWEAPNNGTNNNMQNFLAGLFGFKAFLDGPPAGTKIYPQYQSMRFRRRELQHLRIQAVFPVGEQLLAHIQANPQWEHRQLGW